MDKQLKGIFIPMVTPFQEQKVAVELLKGNVEKLNETNVTGYMPLGTNGEFRSLTEVESLKVLEVVAETKADNKILMAGTGRESLVETIDFTQKAAAKGIEYACVLTPHYFAGKMTDKVLINYYVKVADESPVPVLIYCAPKYAAGVTVSPGVIKELAQHPNIAGMKDTSSSNIIDYLIAAGSTNNFKVLAGSISTLYTGLTLGAVGGTISMANYLPDLCDRLNFLLKAQNNEETKRLYLRLYKLNKLISSKYGVAGVKAAMNIFGYQGGEPRLPVLPLTDADTEELKGNLINYLPADLANSIK